MHLEVAAILQELDVHRARFIVFCRALGAEELAFPVPGSDWLVRDFIAHLATIDEPVSAMFRAMQAPQDDAGSNAEAREPWDVDRWNQRRVEERRDRTVDQLLAEAAEQRVALRKVLAQFDGVSLGRTLHFGGDARRPPADIEMRRYLQGWCKHDPMHAVDMLRALPARRTPLVEQWIADPAVQAYQAQMNR